jgi:hypothetical protein
VAITAVLAGFASTNVTARYNGGGHAGGGYHGGGQAARMPIPNYHPAAKPIPRKPIPQKPTPHKPVPQRSMHQKPVPQQQVAQKHELQKHAPQEHASLGHSPGTVPPGKTQPSQPAPNARRVPHSWDRPLPSKHSGPTSSPSRLHPPLNAEKKPSTSKSPKKSHALASYHGERRDPGWHHSPWHHSWRHYGDYYDGYYDNYYDDYWYATNPFLDYAEVQRQAAIYSIRAQVAVAEEVLQSAVSRQEMLESELRSAQQRISSARATIDGAVAQQSENNRAMRGIEAELIAKQESDSELVQAQADVDAMRAALDGEVHRVLSLPPHEDAPGSADYAHEIAMLSPGQKEKLDADGPFRAAAEKLRAAVQKVGRARQALFEKDPDWVAARDKAAKARQEQTQADRDLGKVTGVAKLGRKLDLYDVQNLAAQAREIIAAGRAALRSLGADVPAIQVEGPASSSS